MYPHAGSRPAEAPGQPDPQPSTWLREEVERKKAAAAARLAAQRAQQEALSVAIRAMRGTSAGEDGQGQVRPGGNGNGGRH